MKKIKMKLACMLLGSSLVFSSCIGSFALWNQLKDWNMGIGNKFVNEVVFLAFNIIPVYGVAYMADALVINSIEFWSGSNPLADNIGTTKVVKGENGDYLITTNENGYTISKEGEKNALNLVYDKENNTWNANYEGESYELMTMNEDGSITVKLQDGNTVTVLPDQQGVASVRSAVNGQSSLFATR